LWSGVFAPLALGSKSPDQQNCHDLWTIPCEAPQEEIEKCTHDLKFKSDW
jgi:hypothetical protein